MKLFRRMDVQSRRLLRDAAWFVGLYLGSAGLLALGFMAYRIEVSMLGADEAREMVDNLRRLSAFFLGLGCAALAGVRIEASHPAFRKPYHQWLTTTPWQRGQPLPLGSPLPGWFDLVFVGAVGAYAYWHLPTQWVVWLLAVYPVVYALAALVPLLYSGGRPQIAHAVTLLLLGSVLLMFYALPWMPVVVAPLMLAVAWHGVWVGLGELPHTAMHTAFWDRPKDQPYLSGIEPIDIPPPIRWHTALACSAFVAYWVGLLTELTTELVPVFLFALLFAVIGRCAVYAKGCAQSVPLGERIRRWRWVVPCDDMILVAPMLAILVGVTAVGLGLTYPLDPPITAGLTAFVVLLILLKVGPSRRRWRLTGRYRVESPGEHRRQAT